MIVKHMRWYVRVIVQICTLRTHHLVMCLFIVQPHQFKHMPMTTYQAIHIMMRYIQLRVQTHQMMQYVSATNTPNNGIVGKAMTERHTMMIATHKEQRPQLVVIYRSRQPMRSRIATSTDEERVVPRGQSSTET